MPRKTTKTIQLDPEDARALKRAEADGVSSSELGLADGVLAALAERLRIYRILTIDHEDFGPLRIGGKYSQRLETVP